MLKHWRNLAVLLLLRRNGTRRVQFQCHYPKQGTCHSSQSQQSWISIEIAGATWKWIFCPLMQQWVVQCLQQPLNFQARVAAVVSSALKPCWTAVKQCDCTVVLTLQCLLWNWYIVLNVQCVCCNFLQESQVILQQILQSCYDSTRKASYYHKFPYRNFRKYWAKKTFM